MEEKNMRELSKDEMDKISGGMGQQTFERDRMRYRGERCPKCGESESLEFLVLDDQGAHWHCLSCEAKWVWTRYGREYE